MTGDLLMGFLYDGCYLALVLAAPALAVSMLVGLVFGVLSAITQVHDPSLVFVPRLAAVFGTLLLSGSLMGERLIAFTREVLRAVS